MQHVVSVSGGKDSTATYCRALERGLPFRAVAADTGNEHPATYEAVNNLAKITGGPEVEWVRADFTDKIAHRRTVVVTKWRREGVPEADIERTLSVLQPTGNPYVDLCLWKGRFPSRMGQFCTVELKVRPIDEMVTKPLMAAGETVISWQGVRAAESFERSLLPPFQWINPEYVAGGPTTGKYGVWRPLLRVSDVSEVFAISARHGLSPNPLYAAGCSRVGCFPCINASKAEIALVDRVFPEQIERLEEWEALVSKAAKRGVSTFFNVTNDPVMAEEMRYSREVLGVDPTWTLETHGVREMIQWAKTDRGGRQWNLFKRPESTVCSTHGACE